MSLTFLGILIIWGMMALFVRWMHEKDQPEEPEESTAEHGNVDISTDLRLKSVAAATAVAHSLSFQKQAAAVAVSVALQTAQGGFLMNQSIEETHAWQLVHRMTQINRRNQSFNRKPRGE
jgi:hypothetical protein